MRRSEIYGYRCNSAVRHVRRSRLMGDRPPDRFHPEPSQGLLHQDGVLAVSVVPGPSTCVDVTRGLIELQGGGVRGTQSQTNPRGAQRDFTRPEQPPCQTTPAYVGMDPDRGNPPQPFSPPSVPDHEPDNPSGANRLQRNRLREREGCQDIYPRPGVALEASSLQLEDMPEISPGGRLDRRLVRLLSHAADGPLSPALAEALQKTGELHGHDELGCRARPHRLQCLEVLQGHRLLID